jgi:hypothetical protein
MKMTAQEITTKIRNLVEDVEFRQAVAEAIRSEIPADVWNADAKLQSAVYMKFAAQIVLED